MASGILRSPSRGAVNTTAANASIDSFYVAMRCSGLGPFVTYRRSAATSHQSLSCVSTRRRERAQIQSTTIELAIVSFFSLLLLLLLLNKSLDSHDLVPTVEAHSATIKPRPDPV